MKYLSAFHVFFSLEFTDGDTILHPFLMDFRFTSQYEEFFAFLKPQQLPLRFTTTMFFCLLELEAVDIVAY